MPESIAIAPDAAPTGPSLAERLGQSSVPAVAVDRNGRVVAASAMSSALLSTSAGPLVGGMLVDLFGHRHGEPTLAVARRVLNDGQTRVRVLMWRGHWIRSRYTLSRDGSADVCVIKLDPWLVPAFENTSKHADAVEEFPVHDLHDLAAISAREAEVLWMIGQGLSMPQIARKISRSIKTIESHVRAIGSKLNLRGRFAIGLFAERRGLTHMTRDQVERVFAERTTTRAHGGVSDR